VTPDPRGVRVLLVDDQELVRSGLTRILRPADGFEIVGECGDGGEVPDRIRTTDPDVVVMDLRMREVDGIRATRWITDHHPALPVLVLTTFDDDELLAGALRAGAAGFVLKDAPAEDLIRAVRTVAAGEAWLDPAVAGRVIAGYRQAAPGPDAGPPPDRLTARERDVLELIARGLANGEVATQLGISEVTVKSHVGHIFTKLGLRDRAAAIVYAYDQGLVTPRRRGEGDARLG
jgi:DNA-binding NarL/FixJ family response regulator